MQKLRNSVLLVLLAAALGAQTSSGIMSPEVKRIGMRLACLCGACNNTVGDCLMLECSYCRPVREKMAVLVAAGKDEQSVVDAIVGERGRQALAVPPNEGFNSLAWWMPYIALLAGLGGVALFLRKYIRKPAPAAHVNSEMLDRYSEQIEKDMNKLE